MARKPLLPQLLIWTTLSAAFAHCVELGGDITRVVPECARDCVVGFIGTSFPSIDCGTSASLQCLCSARSASGFTIGEGALQCLVGEIQAGACTGDDTSDSVAAGALNMCSSQPSASPLTHAVLTASFVVPSSGGAVSIILPTQTGLPTRTTSFSTPTPSTLVTSTKSSPVTSTTKPTSTTADSSPTQSAEPATSTTLATSQIVGISVGAAGALAVALGLIFIARHFRKRRYPESEREFFPMADDRSSPEPAASRLSRIFHISSPQFRTSRCRPDIGTPVPPLVQGPPYGQSTERTADVDRDMIGLAISRPRSQIPPRFSFRSPVMSPPETPEIPAQSIQRKPSRLLPPKPAPKPALTLAIPPPATTTTRVASSLAPPTTGRDSTMTNMTAFADLDTEAAEGEQVWRPPPTDPLSATTLYVADRWGNWVLSNNNRQSQVAQIAEAAELDTYTPLTKSPIEKREEEARRETMRMASAISAASALPRAPQRAFLSADAAQRANSRASSLYSQASAVRQSRGVPSNRRNSLTMSRNNSGSKQIDRSDSKASTTTINTTSTGPFDDDFAYEPDIARLSHLSPVMESPSPASGRSQVTYPKIPGRLGGMTMRMVPPPKKPNFMGSPPGQPSPTLGTVLPAVRDSPGAYPAPLRPRRPERPARPLYPTFGSGFSPEVPNIEVFPARNVVRPDRTQTPLHQISRPGFSPVQADRNNNTSRDSWRPERVMQTPVQGPRPSGLSPTPQTLDRFPMPPTPPSGPESRQNDGRGTHIASQQTTTAASPMSSRTISSAASSLLAKRIGNDRAAALALDANGGRNRPPHWRRQPGDNGLLSPEMAALASPLGTGTLPMTPTWQPKLTPTRRGDDLFLNVQ